MGQDERRRMPEKEIRKEELPRFHTVAFLSTVENIRQRRVKHGQDDSFSFRDAIHRLQKLEYSPRSQDIFVLLFEEGVPAGVLRQLRAVLKQELNGVVPELSTEFVRENFFNSEVLVEHAGFEFKGELGGQAWLTDFLTAQADKKSFSLETAHRLHALARDLSMGYGTASGVLAYLIALSMDNPRDPSGRSDTRLLANLEVFLANRLREAEGREVRDRVFFEQLRRFFAMYADITAKVARHAGEAAATIDKRAKEVLSSFLQAPEFVGFYDTPSEGPLNPFLVFQKMLSDGKVQNPWLLTDCADTPFDAKKFHLLITPDAPRGVVAEALIGLNQYQSELDALKARNLGQEPDAWGPPTKSQHKSASGRAWLRSHLQQAGSISVWPTKERMDSQKMVHPIAVLLRMISPEKMARNSTLSEQFWRFFAELTVPQSPQEIAIVASSIRDVLADRDPFLNVPLHLLHDPSEKKKDELVSIRKLLIDFAKRVFSREVIRRGPYVFVTDRKVPEEKELYTPVDLLEYSKERIAEMKKHFNTAAGTGAVHVREWLLAAARAWNRIPESYQSMLKFTEAQARKFYGLTPVSSVLFYKDATTAVRDVVRNLIRIKRGDRVLITNQEYDHITDEFMNRGAKKISDEDIIYVNDRKTGRALSPEEIIAQLEQKVRSGKVPKAFIASIKTRFGDAPAAGNGERCNTAGLAIINKWLKQHYPEMAKLGDDCQGFSRNDEGEEHLEQLGFDIFINSGAKAAGVPNVATLILRTKFPNKNGEPAALNWLSHLDKRKSTNPTSVLQPGSSTEDIVSIGALGMAMQLLMGNQDSWSLTEIPSGSTLRQTIAERMRRLSKYFIEEAYTYHRTLLKPGFLPIPVSEEERLSKKAREFGVDIVYPVHRSEKNYDGIVTFTIPTIAEVVWKKGDNQPHYHSYLAKKLGNRNFEVIPCLKGYHAVRVSFNMLQDKADIDALFDAIREIHREALVAKINDKKITTFAELSEKKVLVPNTWMEN